VDWINPTVRRVHSLSISVQAEEPGDGLEKVKANRGSGGVDGKNLEAFEAQRNQQLERLQRELKEDTYQPLPVRQHPIPKRDKPGEYRMLGIPAIYDACANKRCSIGWSLSSSRIRMMLASDIGEGDPRRMRCAKCGKRYKADQSGSSMRISETSSGSADHENSSRLVAQRVADSRVLRLIKAMLKAEATAKGSSFLASAALHR